MTEENSYIIETDLSLRKILSNNIRKKRKELHLTQERLAENADISLPYLSDIEHSDGTIPATKPGKRYCLYRDELDKWLESSRKNPVPLSDEELSESISSSHRRKPNKRNW